MESSARKARRRQVVLDLLHFKERGKERKKPVNQETQRAPAQTSATQQATTYNEDDEVSAQSSDSESVRSEYQPLWQTCGLRPTAGLRNTPRSRPLVNPPSRAVRNSPPQQSTTIPSLSLPSRPHDVIVIKEEDDEPGAHGGSPERFLAKVKEGSEKLVSIARLSPDLQEQILYQTRSLNRIKRCEQVDVVRSVLERYASLGKIVPGLPDLLKPGTKLSREALSFCPDRLVKTSFYPDLR
jgi:hypothetical protein